MKATETQPACCNCHKYPLSLWLHSPAIAHVSGARSHPSSRGVHIFPRLATAKEWHSWRDRTKLQCVHAEHHTCFVSVHCTGHLQVASTTPSCPARMPRSHLFATNPVDAHLIISCVRRLQGHSGASHGLVSSRAWRPTRACCLTPAGAALQQPAAPQQHPSGQAPAHIEYLPSTHLSALFTAT